MCKQPIYLYHDQVVFFRDYVRSLVEDHYPCSPFINVTVTGMFWGFHHDLPCLKLDKPDECGNGEGWGNDDWGDDWNVITEDESFEVLIL